MRSLLSTILLTIGITGLLQAQHYGQPFIELGPDTTVSCDSCINLYADLQFTGLTSDYAVDNIAYNPPAPFNGGIIFLNQDDIWSAPLSISFPFCFYEHTYNKLVIGANGVVSFDTLLANQFCEWAITYQMVGGPPPNGAYFNSINGAYHDMDPSAVGSGNINYVIGGVAPYRYLAINYYAIVQYDCNYSTTTQQIVLYETTNVIDVYLENKPTCTSWNDGNALLGIQNATGTKGVVAPGRNTGPWAAQHEAWRFTPAGQSNVALNWYDSNHHLMGTSAVLKVCPRNNTYYTAEAVYSECDGSQVVVSDSIFINSTSNIALQVSSSPSSCGLPDGSAIISVTSGTAPFTYQWDANTGYQTDSVATGLFSGTYSVTVTDSSGCISIASVTVNNTSGLSASSGSTPPYCHGDSSGYAYISAMGGTTPYTYAWDSLAGYQTTDTAIHLAAGTYHVTVTDSMGCIFILTQTVNDQSELVVNPIAYNPTCFGASNGYIILSSAGGAPPYTYQWDSSAGSQTSNSVHNLSDGNYSFTVSDHAGCTYTSNVQLTEPSPLTTTATKIDDPFCYGIGGNAGVVIPSGGTPGYTFLWDTSAASQTTDTAINLAAGNYYVTVTDFAGCSVIDSVSITGSFSINHTITAPSCNGLSDGTAGITITGRPSIYTYQWDTNAASQTGSVAYNLSAGNYTVTITDTTGCFLMDSITINDPTILSKSTVNPQCAGDNNGWATLTAVDTLGLTYTYAWDANTGNQTDSTASNLASGTYLVTITSSSGCSYFDSVTLYDPPPLTTSMSVNNALCYQGTGNATVTASGGVLPYTYFWDAAALGQRTQTAYNLSAGNYTVNVTDSVGCSVVDSAIIHQPPGWTISYSIDSISCPRGNNGSIAVAVTGGTGSYTYHWNSAAGNQTGDTAFNLTAGIYHVTITDSLGCATVGTAILTDPYQIGHLVQDPPCYDPNGGWASVTINGSTSGYSYSWDSNTGYQTGDTAFNLAVGTYQVTITDSMGCTFTDSVVVTGAASVTFDINDPACFGDSSGWVSISSGGNSSGYTYTWDVNTRNQTGDTAFNLAAGSYLVTVTDNGGCSVVDTVTLIDPQELSSAQLFVVPPSCNGGNNGLVGVTATGGTPGYSYIWGPNTGNQTGDTAHGLTAGSYALTITDSLGCIATDTFTVSEPTALSIGHIIQAPTCFGTNNGQIFVTASGGTPGYTYTWSSNTGNQTGNTAINLAEGTYRVTVTDAAGCSAIDFIVLVSSSSISASLTVNNASCYGENTVITCDCNTGNPPCNFSWSTGSDSSSAVINSSGNYCVTITDGSGCEISPCVTANVLPPPGSLSLSLTATDATTNGGSDGSISATVSGGSGGYTYNWSNADTGASITGLTAGTYSVTVTDANGCIIVDSTIVSQPVGIGSIDRSLGIQLFPNPSGGLLNITTTSRFNGKIVIISTLGATVKQFELTDKIISEIDCSDLSKGIYMYQVLSTKGEVIATGKISFY